MVLTYWLILSSIINISFMNIVEKNCNDDKCNRILDGDYAHIRQFPHSVALFKKKGGSIHYHCTGSILRRRIVLTAAHCKANAKGKKGSGKKWNKIRNDITHRQFKNIPNGYFILAGHTDIADYNAAYTIRSVVKFVLHDCHSYSGESDVALLWLNRNLPFNSYIKPALIKREFPADVHWANVSGWGATEPAYQDESSKKLQYVELKVHSQRTCCKIYKRHLKKRMHKGLLCTGDLKAKGATHQPYTGDSGAALVVSGNQQIGVVGFALEEKSSIVFYANVSYFYDWINTQADKLEDENL